jgi:hypothetical protein
MTLQGQHLKMRVLIVGAFIFCGTAVYPLAHWSAWNDPSCGLQQPSARE